MYCPQCRSELPDDAKYCIKCGYDFTKIKTPPEKKSYQDSLDASGTLINQEIEVESFKVGSLFANRYEILSEGLKGGMGVVYKCKDTMLNKIKALKVIHPRLLNSKQALSRFRQEVAISQELNHENIVRVYDIESWDGKEYFTMEWVEGVTLRDIITERKKEHRPFRIEEAQKIIFQLADALDHAHKYTIHRDIKPENILVTNDEERKVKLTDFGIAKMLSPSQFTSTSIQMGTPYYMAPEQKTDSAHVDKRADIYALGVVLFELLTLENTIGFELPSEINKSLPKEIDNVIKKALATKPEDRYGDAKEFSEAVGKIAPIELPIELQKSEEEKRREVETIRKDAEKLQLENEKIKAEEQQKRDEEQKYQFAEIKPGKTEQKFALNKVVIAVAAIAIVLMLFGVYIYNSNKEKDKIVAIVGKFQITTEEYWKAYDRTFRFYKEVYKDAFNEKMQKDLKEKVLDSLVDEKVLLIASKEAGISVSDEELQDTIAREPAFMKNGAFDKGIYLNRLKLNRMTPELFENLKRQELTIQKMGFFVNKDNTLSKEDQEKKIKDYIADYKKKVNIVINKNLLSSSLPTGIIAQKSITPAEALGFIQAYYKATRENDLTSVLGYYADDVDYYGKGRVSKDFIRKDKEYYFKRWSTIENTVEGEVNLSDTAHQEIKIVQFITSFHVRNSSKAIRGRAENMWKLKKNGDQLQIIDEKQTVLGREAL